MARSEENTIMSNVDEADGNENPPMKVYKPTTWTSQPGARLTKYELEGQPAATVLAKQRPDTDQSSASKYVDRPQGSGSYDVLSEYQDRIQAATAVRRVEPNAELSSGAQNADVPHNSASYDIDAGLTTYELRGQTATTVPQMLLPNIEGSSASQNADGHRSSGSYDVVDDETRTIEENEEAFSDASSKGFTPNYLTAPTSLPSPNKKTHFDIPETEHRGEGGYPSLWRKVLDATSIPATIPDAPKARRSVLGQGRKGLASARRSKHKDSRHVTTGPNPDASSQKALTDVPVLYPEGTREPSHGVSFPDAMSPRRIRRGRTTIPKVLSLRASSDPLARKVAPAHEEGDASPPYRIASLRSPVIESAGEDEEERMEDHTEVAKHNWIYYAWVISTALFVLLVVPVAILILTHRRFDFTASRRKENVTAEILHLACVEDANDTVVCTEYPSTALNLEDQAWQPPNDSEPLPRPEPMVGHEKPATLVRPVICVLNLGTQEFWERYEVNNILKTYCAIFLWESLSLGTPKDHKPGRRGTLAVEKENFDLMVEHTGQLRTAGNGTLPIYVTLGGERSDSPAYVKMLQDERWQLSIVASLRRFDGALHGINVYWNHPRDSCDTKSTSSIKGLHLFLRRLKGKSTELMLTVPPSRDLVRHYGLTDSVLNDLSYVLVTTHKLQPCDGVVSCSGARQFAATAFLRVRADYGIRHRHKFAYSISARVDTFLAKEVTSGSASHTISPEFGVHSWNKSKVYLGLTDVCRAKKVHKSKDDECTLAVLDNVDDADGVTWHRLATYTSPDQMRLRMQRAFDDAMGDAAVALFDSQLDDISGECEAVEGLPSPSLLVVAMATTGPQVKGIP